MVLCPLPVPLLGLAVQTFLQVPQPIFHRIFNVIDGWAQYSLLVLNHFSLQRVQH
jgi:hypothetical protein